MKWLRFSYQGQVGFGNLQDDVISVHSGQLFHDSRPTGLTLPVASVEILCPCEPSKILALWNNFRAAADKNGWAAPHEPLYFLKSPNSYAHHLETVFRPRGDLGRVIYEAELGIVIGLSGKNIALEDSAHHIFGYTCINDITAIELLRSDASFDQWTRAKNFDGFTPFGPWIETELDVASARVKAIVNGRERQNYPLSDMFFSPQELVSRLSRDMTLQAGDIIACGTSLGAMPWQNDVEVDVCIEGIGSLRNTLKESS